MFSSLFGSKTRMVTPEDALPGRATRSFDVPATHEVLGTPLEGPFPEGLETFYVGLGCFWGAEKRFWNVPGVIVTAVPHRRDRLQSRRIRRPPPHQRDVARTQIDQPPTRYMATVNTTPAPSSS